MILTRTPFRITLGGGGTDLPKFYEQHGGFLFSACINKFMYVGLNWSAAENLIRVTHSDAEVVNSLEEVKHDLAREAMKHMGEGTGLEIVSFADMPPGTGLGSSVSYLVGLLKALHEKQGKTINEQDLAELAFHLEANIIKNPVGKQDQYLASFGGFVCMDIAKDGKVKVIKPDFKKEIVKELEEKALMFYTFKRHDTREILKDQQQKAAVSGSQTEAAMLKIKDIGKQLFEEFSKGSVSNFGKLMHEHWLAKKSISTKMSDPWLDEMYDLGISKGADGGKIMGSGGGGCFLFFVPKDQSEFILEMEKQGLKHVPYKFWQEGSEVIYKN